MRYGSLGLNLAHLRKSPEILLNIVLHELFHVLGSLHEHQRPDRDLYVDLKGREANANPIIDGRVIGEYDYMSISHYSLMNKFPIKKFDRFKQCLRDNGAPKDKWYEGKSVGRFFRLSNGDLEMIRLLYGNPLQNAWASFDCSALN